MSIRRGVLSSLLQSSAARRPRVVSIADLSDKDHLPPPANPPRQHWRFISSRTSSPPDVIYRSLQSSSVIGTSVSTLSYKIDVGDVICEIETDKATLEFESLEEGYLAKILAPEGSKDVLVGQPIAITVEDPDEIKNIPADISKKSEVKEVKSAQVAAKKESTQSTGFGRISPSAKLLITEYGLEASSPQASGPRGTLLKGDILEAIKSGRGSKQVSRPPPEKASLSAHTLQPTTQTSPQSGTSSPVMDAYKDLPNSQIRKVIAKRLLESKQGSPHLYLSSDQHNVKVSVNNIVKKAVALALKNVPEANAYWNDEKGEASLCDSIDISIAVATEKVKELAEKARAGKLAPHQFQGGTFSISNLGMFPVDHFCAIINPPQACILAVGRGNMVVEPVIGSDGIEKPAVVTKMSFEIIC